MHMRTTTARMHSLVSNYIGFMKSALKIVREAAQTVLCLKLSKTFFS